MGILNIKMLNGSAKRWRSRYIATLVGAGLSKPQAKELADEIMAHEKGIELRTDAVEVAREELSYFD